MNSIFAENHSIDKLCISKTGSAWITANVEMIGVGKNNSKKGC